jgi:hypothetical protein
MIDMKVLVYFNFSKNKFGKKMESPSSMRNGRFHPPKCRGKVQKMGVLYTHSPKKYILKIEKMEKRKATGRATHCLCGPQLAGNY